MHQLNKQNSFGKMREYPSMKLMTNFVSRLPLHNTGSGGIHGADGHITDLWWAVQIPPFQMTQTWPSVK